jgi:hypothetical protein
MSCKKFWTWAGGMIGRLGNKQEIVSSNHSKHLSLSLSLPCPPLPPWKILVMIRLNSETRHISSCVLNSNIHVWYCNTVSHSGIWQLKFLRWHQFDARYIYINSLFYKYPITKLWWNIAVYCEYNLPYICPEGFVPKFRVSLFLGFS